jgi:hypothetical protein
MPTDPSRARSSAKRQPTVPQAHVLKLAASHAWEEAQVSRETGRGRRPRRSQVVTLSKRVNLAAASYERAVERLAGYGKTR